VQWLGELWRKYHQVFTLLDTPRLADFARDFGAGFNPFDAHRRAVVALETLVERPELARQAAAAGIDLLVVDEAQRLRRRPGHPGEPEYRAIAPIAALGRHVLLLSATPLEDDAHGFFRLLRLLRPDNFRAAGRRARLASGVPLPPCTSSTRRVDIGNLRRACRSRSTSPQGGVHTLSAGRAFQARLAPATVPTRLWPLGARWIASGRRWPPVRRSGRARSDETELRGTRTWIAPIRALPGWRRRPPRRRPTRRRGVRRRTDARDAARADAKRLATGVFHEALPVAARPMAGSGRRRASLLVSTEAGGEPATSVHRLVLYDLRGSQRRWAAHQAPRSHRRRMPVDVVYSVPPPASAPTSSGCSSGSGVFRQPVASVGAAARRATLENRARPGRAVRCPHRPAHRRGAGGAHAGPRSGLSAAPSRAVSSRAGAGDPRASRPASTR
jgi:ATP-dependent helicase HepA